MAENKWEWLYMAGMAVKGRKMLEIARKDWRWLEWLEMAGYCWKFLELTRIAGNG